MTVVAAILCAVALLAEIASGGGGSGSGSGSDRDQASSNKPGLYHLPLSATAFDEWFTPSEVEISRYDRSDEIGRSVIGRETEALINGNDQHRTIDFGEKMLYSVSEAGAVFINPSPTHSQYIERVEITSLNAGLQTTTSTSGAPTITTGLSGLSGVDFEVGLNSAYAHRIVVPPQSTIRIPIRFLPRSGVGFRTANLMVTINSARTERIRLMGEVTPNIYGLTPLADITIPVNTLLSIPFAVHNPFPHSDSLSVSDVIASGGDTLRVVMDVNPIPMHRLGVNPSPAIVNSSAPAPTPATANHKHRSNATNEFSVDRSLTASLSATSGAALSPAESKSSDRLLRFIFPKEWDVLTVLNFSASAPGMYASNAYLKLTRSVEVRPETAFVLPIQINVVANPVEVIPASEVSFGTLTSPSQRRTRTITIANRSLQPIAIQSIRPLKRDSRMTITYAKSLGGGTSGSPLIIPAQTRIDSAITITYTARRSNPASAKSNKSKQPAGKKGVGAGSGSGSGDSDSDQPIDPVTGDVRGSIVVFTNSTMAVGRRLEIPYSARIFHGSLAFHRRTILFASWMETAASCAAGAGAGADCPSTTGYSATPTVPAPAVIERDIELSNRFSVPVQVLSASINDSNFHVSLLEFERVVFPNERWTAAHITFRSNHTRLSYTADLRLTTNITVLHMPLIVYSGQLSVITAPAMGGGAAPIGAAHTSTSTVGGSTPPLAADDAPVSFEVLSSAGEASIRDRLFNRRFPGAALHRARGAVGPRSTPPIAIGQLSQACPILCHSAARVPARVQLFPSPQKMRAGCDCEVVLAQDTARDSDSVPHLSNADAMPSAPRVVSSLATADPLRASRAAALIASQPHAQWGVLEVGALAIGEVREQTLTIRNTNPIPITVFAPVSSAQSVTASLHRLPFASVSSKSSGTGSGAGRFDSDTESSDDSDDDDADDEDDSDTDEDEPASKPGKSPSTDTATVNATSPALDRIVLEPDQAASLTVRIEAVSAANGNAGDVTIAYVNVSTSVNHVPFRLQIRFTTAIGHLEIEAIDFGGVFPGMTAHRTLYATNMYSHAVHLRSLHSAGPRISMVLSCSLFPAKERMEIGSVSFDASRCAATDNYMSSLQQWIPPSAANTKSKSAAASGGAALDIADRDACRMSQRIWRRLIKRGAHNITSNITVCARIRQFCACLCLAHVSYLCMCRCFQMLSAHGLCRFTLCWCCRPFCPANRRRSIRCRVRVRVLRCRMCEVWCSTHSLIILVWWRSTHQRAFSFVCTTHRIRLYFCSWSVTPHPLIQ